MKSKKYKKIRKRIIVSIVVTAILALLFLPRLLKGPELVSVTTTQAWKGDIEAKLKMSGTIASEITRTYFSPVSSVVGTIEVSLGETVSEGTLLLSYDLRELETTLITSQITDQMNQANYNALIVGNGKNKQELIQAESDIAIYEPLITQQKQFINDLEASINNEMIKERTGLYAELRKKEKIQVGCQRQLELTQDNTNVKDQLDAVNFEIADINRKISLLSEYETKDNKEDILLKAKNDLSDMETFFAEKKGKKSASEAAIMDGNELEAKRLQNKISAITTVEEQERLELAKAGIMADFNGVVTELTVIEGSTITAGSPLITVQSYENVKVQISVSKYDLKQLKEGQKAEVIVADKSYEGVVSKINRFATANASGTPMVAVDIHITNPDEAIFLGLEAKVNIHMAEGKNVLLVPMEAVNADKQGDFCFAIVNGIVTRKDVVVGISSDSFVEIKKGLAEGDHVINTGTSVEEGSRVLEVEEK
ncbi:MAG TPA: efflux RND transporter periplasmic adaptor subunit [Lachnospiraceae bacterium]|nr:efflux RND transporter periplasmic adaptor subunit [Lachnospiraceae bacterium]